MREKNRFLDPKFVLLLCLSLGLAPFYPEPHIWGKLRWIAGGAQGMGLMDWFDTLMHGFPWLLLVVLLWTNGRKSYKTK